MRLVLSLQNQKTYIYVIFVRSSHKLLTIHSHDTMVTEHIRCHPCHLHIVQNLPYIRVKYETRIFDDLKFVRLVEIFFHSSLHSVMSIRNQYVSHAWINCEWFNFPPRCKRFHHDKCWKIVRTVDKDGTDKLHPGPSLTNRRTNLLVWMLTLFRLTFRACLFLYVHCCICERLFRFMVNSYIPLNYSSWFKISMIILECIK